jgi:hypothetical protein
MVKVQNHHSLYKTTSGAVINTDQKAYDKAKERKREKERMNNLESKIERLEMILEKIVNGNKP